MLLHYIKIALRNLRKYPAQTAISVLGLAAGFVCLSLSALWMHYENTYDTMHKDYERIYAFQSPYHAKAEGTDWHSTRLLTSMTLARALPTFPEVEAATACRQIDEGLLYNGIRATHLETDSTFLNVFDLPLIEGRHTFLYRPHEMALTESMAKRLFPDKRSPLGETVKFGFSQYTVAAVVPDCPPHSIFSYDCIYRFMNANHIYDEGNTGMVFAKAYELADMDTLAARAYRFKIWGGIGETHMLPLKESHRHGGNYLSLSYAHLQTFFLCSVLMVVCALINYLVLYLIRLRSREREMALRIVNGSTVGGLMAMFLIEVAIVLFAAMAFGMLGVEWLYRPFARFASITADYGYIMSRALWIMLITAGICFVLCVVPIAIVRNRTLTGRTQRNDVSRKISSFVQLTVSMAFVFCTVVMFRQVQHLRRTDWGFRLTERAVLQIHYEDTYLNPSLPEWEIANEERMLTAIYSHVNTLPMVADAMLEANDMAHRNGGMAVAQVAAKENGPWEALDYMMGFWDIGNPVYGFTVLEGALPREAEWKDNEVVITDNMRRVLGWETAVGQTIYWRQFNAEKYERCVVVAVIKDIYEQMVTDEARPMGFRPRSFCKREYFSDPGEGDWGTPGQIVLTYERDMRDEFSEAVEQLMKQKFPSYVYDLKFSEDVLAAKLRSETNLMTILGIITAVCILVAVFGVYSIVTLACAQRRKEIALRKIHGATLMNILSIFIKEYGLIVLAASAVAFPIGYMIMKEWVAQYVKQAPIAWWIYAVILLAIVLLIALSVGSRVWRTARENPAEVIKSGN